MRFLPAAVLLLCLAFGGSQPGSQAWGQETLNVPDDYETIQEAIDAAEAGDTVLVAEGAYEENIDFLGKAITVVSEAGAADTTIDGSAPQDDELGAVVRFATGEGNDSVLEGFTLTGGSGEGPFPRGGGIYGTAATPTIRACVVASNEASEAAGIYFEDASDGDPVIIENCVIEFNDAAGSYGGIQLNDMLGEVSDCEIRGNESGFSGGGLSLSYSTVTVTDCLIEENDSGFLGGGISCIGAVSTIVGCTIMNNAGGGVADDNGTMILDRCLIVGNEAVANGGGLIVSSGTDSLEVSRCTFTRNIGDAGGGFFVADTFEVPCSFTSCIFYDNTGGDVNVNDETTFSYSSLTDEMDGDGNIDGDPLFRDPDHGDFRLLQDSACIDAGDPDAPDDPDETAIEMGAFFYNQEPQQFLRGDASGNGVVFGLIDGLFLLQWGFTDGPLPPCFAAADIDGNGTVFAIIDALFVLQYAFTGGDAPPDPGPTECGLDPNELECLDPPEVCL